MSGFLTIPVLAMVHPYWFAVPLIVAISLAYAASRHESWPRIRAHAMRLMFTIGLILVITLGVLLAINTQV